MSADGPRGRPSAARRRAMALVVAALRVDRSGPLPALDHRAWAHVPWLAADHRVVDPVHRALVAEGAAPDGVLADLATRRREVAAAGLATRADLDRALDALEAEGVEALVVKGPVLGRVWWSPPGHRAYGDLDVLVRPRDLAAAVAALEGHAQARVLSDWAERTALGAGEVDLLLPGGTPLDLHWSLLFHPAWRRRMPLPTDALFARAIDMRLDGRPVRTLSAPDSLVHCALHAALAGGQRLVFYVDTAAVAAHDLDWHEVVRVGRDARAGLAVGHTLQRARRWLGVPVPDHVVPELRRGAPAWAAVSDCLDAVRPPRGPEQAWLQGKRWVRAGRQTTATSVGVLSRDLVRGALPRRAADHASPAPPDGAAREAFLQDVARDGAG